MKLTLIGCGNRGSAYAKYFKDEINIICDLNTLKAEKLKEKFNLNCSIYSDYKEALLNDADGIIIASPDFTHKEIFMEAVKTNKSILLEKPADVNIENLKEMYRLGIKYESSILMGYCLRYTFMYKTILELIKNKKIGDIATIEASETLDRIHASSFFRRWHRFSKNSGGFLNTKCSHDIDIINLIANSKPVYVSSFGSNLYFPKNGIQNVCSKECSEYNYCKYVDNNEYEFSSIDTKLCPFNVESDITDHQVAIIEYENGITASFTLSMHGDTGNRTIAINGTKGSIHASFENQTVVLTNNYPYSKRVFKPDDIKGSHGGGDSTLCNYFKRIITENLHINQLYSAMVSSIVAISCDKSRKEKQSVNLSEFEDILGKQY